MEGEILNGYIQTTRHENKADMTTEHTWQNLKDLPKHATKYTVLKRQITPSHLIQPSGEHQVIRAGVKAVGQRQGSLGELEPAVEAVRAVSLKAEVEGQRGVALYEQYVTSPGIVIPVEPMSMAQLIEYQIGKITKRASFHIP